MVINDKNHSIKRKPNLCGIWGHTPLIGSSAFFLLWHCLTPSKWTMAPHTTQSFGFLLVWDVNVCIAWDDINLLYVVDCQKCIHKDIMVYSYVICIIVRCSHMFVTYGRDVVHIECLSISYILTQYKWLILYFLTKHVLLPEIINQDKICFNNNL